MLHSKFGREFLPQKKKSSYRPYFFLLFLAIFIAGLYWGFKNYQRLLFKIKKDKYTTIVQKIETYEKSSVSLNSKEDHDDKNPNLTEIDELLTRLIHDNPSDGYLYYLFGKLYTIECTVPIIKDNQKLTEIFFLDYIKKYHGPAEISYNHWEKGITYTRKALLLGLPDTEKEKAIDNLVSLFLIGGTPYWDSAVDYLKPEEMKKPDLIYNLYKLVFTENMPDWEQLTKLYGDETGIFWMGLYYLKINNYPLAFFNLKKLLLSDSIYLRNNAYYIMGYTMGGQKDMALKLYYHSMIDFDEFLKRNPWFLEEHNYTLRYMGQEGMAKKFLGQYEKLVLDLKDSL